MMPTRSFRLASLVGVLAASPALGDSRSTIASLPDLDGDRLPEVAVVSWDRAQGSRLTLCRGASGTMLLEWSLEGPFLAMTAIEHERENPLFIVACYPADLQAFDLSTGELEWQVELGPRDKWGETNPVTNLATVPDLDGDGSQEVVVAVGNRSPVEEGSLRLLSGTTGIELGAWESFEIGGRVCRPRVALENRFNPGGERSAEVWVGVRFTDVEDEEPSHAIAIFDLERRKARLLTSVEGRLWLLGDTGDMDGDGVHDLAVTHEAWFLDVLSGADGRLLHRRDFSGGVLWHKAQTLAVLQGTCGRARPQVVFDGVERGFLRDAAGRDCKDTGCEETIWWAYSSSETELVVNEDIGNWIDLGTWHHPQGSRGDGVLVHAPKERRILLIEDGGGRVRWNQSLRED